MIAPLPRARAGSVSSTHHNSLRVLLGVLVAIALGALALELSFVTPDTITTEPEKNQDILHVLDAAAAAEDSDKPPTGADAFYPDEVFDIDWSQRIKESDILHEAALHRGCVKHKMSVISWKFGEAGENETQNLMHVMNESDPQLLDKLRQCPDVDIFLPEGLRSFGYCEDAAAYTKSRPEKNFSDVTFLHTAGTSIQKGTRQVLDCWLTRPDFPRLELHMAQDLFDGAFKTRYARRIDKSRNVALHTGRLEPAEFGRLITDAAYFMCPSLQEGYGHYINQARSSRALIFTTDIPPMNELITPSSGALIRARAIAHEPQFLGGKSKKEHALRGVPGFVADFGGRSVCNAVTKLLQTTTPEERAERADRALQQYYFDTVFFAQKMQELHDFARAHSHLGRLHGVLRRREDTPLPSEQ
ncbi:hypothetical protein PInf_005112 [Phytophthora infestans]|nr:hypothetical protein PInf_005112 [Phytophthora infestans]